MEKREELRQLRSAVNSGQVSTRVMARIQELEEDLSEYPERVTV